ncbi:MAG: 4Fe-4S dicluster domain-containing protein [Bacteroidales bacterium]|nr:4Fe-4S dicluster domain-containing protein [Bacteroidales bacterium]
MLRKIRIALAAVFFVGITLLFVGIGHDWWGWMAKLQFLPSALTLNFAVIAGILLLTFVFGRIYCSVICPMGVFQDVVLWIRRAGGKWMQNAQTRRLKKLKESGATGKPKVKQYLKRFDYVKEHKWVRYPVLVLSIVSIFVSGQMLIALIAPYSAYGRIVRSIAGAASGSIVPALLVTGLVTLVVIFCCAWLWGREYCNTICPVGTTLSLVSRFSLFRPTIELDKCINCGRCGKGCKASCIDTKNHKIDYSRCVVCFDCLDNCTENALKYRFVGLKSAKIEAAPAAPASSGQKGDGGRRAFLATTVLAGTALAAKAQDHMQGGLAEVIDKQNPERGERLVPFGAGSVKSFYDHCTACQLCVSACPNGVLRPSTDFAHFMQPQMGYDKGYCRPECNACSQVCPAGAIRPVAPGEKQTIQIGIAHVNLEHCIAAKGQDSCGNCSYHCPSGAIRMVKSEVSQFQIPTVTENQCIGCGACENLCPSRPVSAITVRGIPVHHTNA